MEYKSLITAVITAALLQLATWHTVQAQSRELYRYTNDQGTKVITDSLSPEDAARGYDIIDSKGNLIKRVPRELSKKEKEQLEAQRAEEARLKKWDKELRTRYNTINDIESTKKRRLDSIDNSISSLKRTLENISETIKHYQAEAASNERQGEEVNKDTLASITRLQQDKLFIQNELERQQIRRKEIESRYNTDIERFNVISEKTD